MAVIHIAQEHRLWDIEDGITLAILRQRNFWGIALPRFLADPTWGTLTFWMPLYLNSVRHFDLKQIALFAWMPFLAADLGSMFGGVVSLWLQKRAGLSTRAS